MEKYTTLTGHALQYPTPTGAEADFLVRVVKAAADPGVSIGELIELIYGNENPILDQTIFPGLRAVTSETFKNPLYHVMLDLLDQKRVQLGALNLDVARDRFTMTVGDAAKALGITPSAVRQAIHSERLASVKQGGTFHLAEDSADAYQVSNQGPKR